MEQPESEELSSQGHAALPAVVLEKSHGQIYAQDQDWRTDDGIPDDEAYAEAKALRTMDVRLGDRNPDPLARGHGNARPAKNVARGRPRAVEENGNL